ncbi:cupredoxin domain-containing protein [Halalkalicoccus salilacus]
MALGTATIREMELPVPGPIKIVNHALSRVTRRGTIAVIAVTGEM